MSQSERVRSSRSWAGLRHACLKAIDGDRVWGTVVVDHNPRAQWSRYTVTVFPPGTTATERRALRAHRAWPQLGALGASIAALLLAPAWPIALVVVSLALIYVAGIWATSKLSADLRRRSIRLRCAVLRDAGGRKAFGDTEDVMRTIEAFDALDCSRDSAPLSGPEYEARWGRVYEALARTHLAFPAR